MVEKVTDSMDPARAQALAATLGLDLAPDAPLPPFFHQVYFWHAVPSDQLGRDGHPARGRAGLVPDLGLPRRMWAGGRLAFHAPLHLNRKAERRTVVESTAQKTGASGPLAFVTLRHDIHQGGVLAVTEWQDLVFREDPAPDAPASPHKAAPSDVAPETQAFSTTLLFRYSALTFNGHRIHYDLDYARHVEGYGGLVVHGPLLAQLLMLRAARDLGHLGSFTFRAISPLLHTEAAIMCRDGPELWVRAPDGRICMKATAR